MLFRSELMRAMNDEGIDTPVIVMSGYATDPVFAQQAQYGYADKLAKPFTRSDLGRVVREVLGADAQTHLSPGQPTPPRKS